MKLRSLLIPTLLICAIGTVWSCSKSNNGSKPKLSLKSVTSPVPVGGSMTAILEYSSSSGKVGEGTFVAIRNRLNQIPITAPVQQSDTFTVQNGIPDFPDMSKGEFNWTVPWDNLHESDQENDTIVFKFAVIDRNGNSSDTITTPKIVIIHQ